MANQPKKYKKFIATAATATLVASAIVPVASAATPEFSDITGYSADVQAAINALATQGIINGTSATTFEPGKEITRGQVVKLLGKWVEAQGAVAPANWKTVERFTDLPVDSADQELLKYAAIAYDAGVFQGSNGVLNSSGKISRENMALVLDRAYDKVFGTSLVELAAKVTNVNVADLATAKTEAQPAIQALKDLEISVSANFNPKGNVTRANFATFLYRALNVKAEATVTAVTATNDKTLTVTGTGLKALVAADFTVANNTVKAVTPAADGKSATVTLTSSLIPDQDTKVTVKDSVSTKEYTVKYSLNLTTVELVEATYDNDLANQKLKFKVNGSLVDADYLALSGYSVNLVAVQKTPAAPAPVVPLFAGATNISTTGVLSAVLTADHDYEIEIQVSKAGVATVSDKGIIKIRNVEAQAQSVDSVRFVNAGITGIVTSTFDTSLKGTGLPDGDDFFLNSKTLVAGEKIAVNNAVATKSGEKYAAALVTDAKVKSSNPAVLSVDATGVVTAESAGTAVITVTVGDASQNYTFTVTNEKRKLVKVTSKDSVVNVIKGNTNPVNIELKAFDQYGDPFGITTGAASLSSSTITTVDEVIPTQVDGITKLFTPAFEIVTTLNSITDQYGTFVLPVNGSTDVNTGSGTVYIKNKASQTVGAFVLNVTEVNNVASQKVEIKNSTATGYSADRTLDLLDDTTVRFQISNFNTQGVYAGAQNLGTGTVANPGAYTISVVNSDIASVKTLSKPAAASVTAAAGENYFEVVGKKAGTTDVLVKDTNGVVVAKETVTVVSNPFAITNVAWKSVPTVDYATKQVKAEDVLSITDAVVGSDDIVAGLTLNKTTTHKVRISTTSITNTAVTPNVTHTTGGLYLDIDGSGDFTAADSVLGVVTGSVATGSKLAGVPASGTFDVILGSAATQAGDDATLLLKIMTDAADATTAISATTVTVKVK